MSTVRVEWNGDKVTKALDRAFDRGAVAACSTIEAAIKAKLSRIGKSQTSVKNIRQFLKNRLRGRKIGAAQQRTFDARQAAGGTWVDKAGGSPRLRTGRLRDSIGFRKNGQADYTLGSTMPTKTGYAAIHEFGGIIKPVRAKFLSFIGGRGQRVFTKKVVIPARPFMRPGFIESQGKAVEAFVAVVNKAIGGTDSQPSDPTGGVA